MDERANPPASGSKDDAFYPSPPADVVPPDIARPGRKFGGARGSTRDEIDAESAEDEKDNHFDEHAQLKRTASGLAGRGMHLVHEPSTRTISSSESTGGGAPPHRELEKKQSARSSVSMGSASDCPDESGFGTFGARASRKASSDGTSGKTFHNAGANSPRAKRFGRGGPGSRRSVNLSTREEEDAALMELYSVIGEENRDKLEFKRNPAGFIIYIELVEVPIDGPVPECICMFSQLIVLVVQRCGVSGSFPFWIDSLIYLQELNLSQNYLVGPIPETLSALKALQELALYENAFSGTIPEGLGELPALTKLELYRNDLTGSIPESICHLSALSELNLSCCYLTGHIPHHIGRLTNLSSLQLQSNHLTGSVPESIGDLILLEELNLSSNNLKGRLPESIGKLHMLSTLNVFHNDLNGNIPAAIGNLASLTSLSMGSNRFRGPIPESICSLSMLGVLNLSKNQLSGAIPPAICHMVCLTSLNLAYNRLKGCIPDDIGNLLLLSDMHLDHNSISGEIPTSIGFMTALTVLTMAQNQLTGEIPEGVGNLPLLTMLMLSNNQLSGMIPETIGGLTSLQQLSLSHNQLIGPIPEGIVNLDQLIELDLSFNRLSGPIPDGIVNLAQLTEVNLIDTYLSGYDVKKGIFLMSSCGIWASDQYGRRGISVVNFEDWNPSFYQNAPLMHREHRKYQIPLSLISLFPHTLFLFPPELLDRIFLDASFYSHIRPAIFAFLKKVCEAQNPCILQCLVVLWYLLTAASKVHISEEADLVDYADEVVRITNELFKCASMDKLKNVQRLILEPRYCQPIQKNLDGTFDSVTYWNMAHIFSGNSPIQFCLEHNHKFVLALTQITNITDQLFWGCINTVPNEGAEEPRSWWEFSNTEFHTLTLYKVFACPRYTPAVMFFIEGLSKLYTLILVSYVCFTTYGMREIRGYSGAVEENLLLMMVVAQISYEGGQLASCDWSLKEYFGGVWNILDVACCTLLLVWTLLLPFPEHFLFAKCAVALSAIPLALVQLQYLSLIKTLGLLVLMIQSMIVDVYVFVVVYLVSIYGFTVSFRALFYEVNDFSSTGITFITLFQSTLGEFHFDWFVGSYKTIGWVVMVCYLTLTNVLLVNLLIAQMSNTYDRIIFKSREEWTFIKATYVQDNLLLEEKNPFCMLPPPLNIFTIFLYPLHTWALDAYNISVAGTAADYLLGIYLMVPRFLFFWWKRVQAVFIDAEEEDEEFQEPYHAIIHVLIWLIGKRLSRILVYSAGMPFGAIYVLISTFLRLFYVVVRVQPREEGSDDAYAINFYLEDDYGDKHAETIAAAKKTSKLAGLVPIVTRKASGLIAQTGNVIGMKRQASSMAGKDGVLKDVNEGAYTFADAKPDAFGVVPDEHDDDHDVTPTKSESKGQKRLKKAMNKKASFIIDPEIYNDPNLMSSGGKRVINKMPSTKFTAKLSFTSKSPNAPSTEGPTPSPPNQLMPRQSFNYSDTEKVPGGSGKFTSFNLNDGRSGGRLVSPKTSFNFNDGATARQSLSQPPLSYPDQLPPQQGGTLSNKSSFNSNDGSAKLTPKLSLGKLDFLNFVPGVGSSKNQSQNQAQLQTPPLTGEPPHDRGSTPPTSARDGSDKDKDKEQRSAILAGGVRAVALANKMIHKAKIKRRLEGLQEGLQKGLHLSSLGNGADGNGAIQPVNLSESLSDQGSPDDETSSPESARHNHHHHHNHHHLNPMGIDLHDLNPLAMFKPHKKRAKAEEFHLPEESDEDEQNKAGGREKGRPSGARRAHSRRLSKLSGAKHEGAGLSRNSQFGYVSSGSETAEDEVDAEGYRMVEEHGSDSDSVSVSQLEEGDEEYQDEEEDDQEDQSTKAAHSSKHVLFTADDIIRMFPANENELAKLEIEDEIRKLKVSSEAAIATATEEMKADFKQKLNQAVSEIRTLKDAIISSRLDRLPVGNRSFTLSDGKGGGGDSAPNTARGGSSPTLGGVAGAAGVVLAGGKIRRKTSSRASSRTPFANNTSNRSMTEAAAAAAVATLAGDPAPVPAPAPVRQSISRYSSTFAAPARATAEVPPPPPPPASPPQEALARTGSVQELILTFDPNNRAANSPIRAAPFSPQPTMPTAAPAAAPAAAPVPTTAAAIPAARVQDVEQMQTELENLKGDMKDIKKLLGNILMKMSK